MKTLFMGFLFLCLELTLTAQDYHKDIFPTSYGDLTLIPIGHASLMFIWNDLTIHVDPVMREANYRQFPKADLIILTHHHGDHTDELAIKNLYTDSTRVILTDESLEKMSSLDLQNTEILKYWESTSFKDLQIEAIPAYNIKHKRANGEPYHPRGSGNGYVLTFGDFKALIGGDTEDIPEYARLESYKIDAAFLPMNVPYTMTPGMVVSAASMIRPRILYPYHYGNTDTDELLELMIDDVWVEVRVKAF